MTEIAAVILGAGKGTRMKSDLPKVLHRIAGRPMVNHVLGTVASTGAGRTVVVVGPDMEDVSDAVAPVPTVIQKEQLGTADAVKAARKELEGFDGVVLVLYGDTPLITEATLRAMVRAMEKQASPGVVVLAFEPEDLAEYGRVIAEDDGTVDRIVETRDASPGELACPLCNSGVMAIAGEHILKLLDAVGNDNAKGEYYLTDVVALAKDNGLDRSYIVADEGELIGVNSRHELAVAETILQISLRDAAMAEGATLTDPDTVYFSFDTEIGRDVVIGPNVVFGPGVSVGDRCEIKAFCHLEGAVIEANCQVGPFARIRPGAHLNETAFVGNFVEVKNATLEPGSKASHLSYIGDARVGAGANIGAGTITCNYDGFLKSHTDIGAGAFIGSNTALVAPVKIGDGAIVGAGSAISKDVDPDALALTRAEQTAFPGFAAKFRRRKQAEKDRKKK